ncbi:MAG: hypothetical protein A3K19_14875 [Lentisphaerae bacterium RIFOXYB12_FULL_65_16]|nr:MAG: hypothetical protein A3K18_27435 [Lentisphaerae bacterium RIFOXYA12_64_32]OGV85907.1 MAG: hypothetical protein A3K19_14875 [Lentisphaerae bacterium RIFOXYB12_FULL_65_16]
MGIIASSRTLFLSACVSLCGLAAAAPAPWQVDLAGDWRFSTGDDPAWASPEFSDADWDTIHAPAPWDSAGYAEYDGYGWYRRTFETPPEATAKAQVFDLGGVDDDDWVYINGKLIGKGKGCYKRRLYPVPAGLLNAGRNLIAVRIFDGGMGGGLAKGPILLGVQPLTDRVALTQCRFEPVAPEQTELPLTLAFTNRTDQPQKAQVDAQLTDYLQRAVGSLSTALDLAPNAVSTVTVKARGGECTGYRLALDLKQGNEAWSTVRYLQTDALAGPRRTLLLNGTWDFLPVTRIENPPPGGEWKPIELPLAGWGGWPGKEHSAWFRRQLDLPPGLDGQRLLLQFQAVAHVSQVYVNGTKVGRHLGGFEPFEFDITSAAKPGAANEVLVGVTDWTAGLKDGTPIPNDVEKDFPANTMLFPYGCRPPMIRGIWQDVSLVAHGDVGVEDVFVTTSVRRQELAVRAQVRNSGDKDAATVLRPVVRDAETQALALEERKLTAPPGQTVTAEWTVSWKDARLWWPSDPHLYALRLEVTADGTVTDRTDTRFGFREFWIDGTDYRLNGRVFRLRGQVCAPNFETPENLRTYFLSHRDEANFSLVRHHMFPRSSYYYDIADELGMCLKDESGFYCAAKNYALTDDRFWQNLKRHLDGMVRRSRNHPSVCIWSTENEILHCGGHKTSKADANIFDASQVISALDPTRPIEFEGDGDMVGRAATVNIHYPREFGCHDHNLWPNDSWWLGEAGNDRWPNDLIWKKDKPLILGEFCYYPYSRPPGGVSIFVGDSVYESREIERAAHVMGVRFVSEGARWAGVTGLNPWVGDKVYGQQCLPPVTAIIREWDHAFWTGETVARHVLVLNDTLEAQHLTLAVTVNDGDTAVWSWSENADFEPGGRHEWEVKLAVPDKAGRYRLAAKVLAGEKLLYTETRPLLAAAPDAIAWPALDGAAIYDPAGKSVNALKDAGLDLVKIDSITPESLKNLRLLVLGQDVWTADETLGKDCLPAFVTGGGRVLVLAQSTLPKWLPCAVRVDKPRGATMTYPRYPGHALLDGIDADGRDLCWWRGDHMVARSLLRKPLSGNFRVITEAGGKGGLLWTPLLELPSGRGTWLLCQYLVDEKAKTEPACRQLLANLLAYPGQPLPETRVAALTTPEFGTYLAALGLQTDMLPADKDLGNLGNYGLVIADSATLAASHVATLRSFVEAGGTLWLHAPAVAGEDTIRSLIPGFKALSKTTAKGRVTKAAQDGLVAGLSNSEFFWYREDCWYEDWEGRGTGLIDDPCAVRWTFAGPVTACLRPLALGETKLGKGRIVFDSLRLAEAAPAVSEKARRIGSVLLTNLGAPLGRQAALAAGDKQNPVDLGAWLTVPLRDDTANDGQGGWTDQGNNDMRELPAGRQTFAGVVFDVTEKGLVLQSPAHLPKAPPRADALKIGACCDTLSFLHTAAWASGSGKTVAKYRIKYEDGTELETPIADGVQVGDWWQAQEELPAARVAWHGKNPAHTPVCLYLYTWRNPKPGVTLTTISVESTGTDTIYALLGLTRGTVTKSAP